VAIARIDPPKAPKGGFLDALRGAFAFYTSPVTTILGAATSRTPKDAKNAYYALPIEVDTVAGTARAIELPAAKGKAGAVVSARNAYARQGAAAVQEAFQSGVVPLKVPAGYRAAAELAAGFEHELPELAEPESPAQDIPFKQFDYGEDNNMGGFLPPGGLAGFSQMVGASKLALTRGGRGRGRVSRKVRARRKKKGAGRPRKVGRPKKRARRAGKKRLVKGSAAAKRYMASIRRKRKRG
jgi:hypothetical protein